MCTADFDIFLVVGYEYEISVNPDGDGDGEGVRFMQLQNVEEIKGKRRVRLGKFQLHFGEWFWVCSWLHFYAAAEQANVDVMMDGWNTITIYDYDYDYKSQPTTGKTLLGSYFGLPYTK